MGKTMKVEEKCREVFRKACPCGAGQLMVDVCRPDEPYPQTKRYRGRFTCEVCGTRYQVREQDTDILLVEQGEIKKREKWLAQWSEECESIMTGTKVLNYLTQFKEILMRFSNSRRLAAYLRYVGLTYQTDQEFEEEFDGPKAWVKHHVRVSHLPKILEILQLEDRELVGKVNSLEELWRRSKAPLEPVDRPLFKKYPY